MAKSVKKNYLYNLSYQVLTIVVPLITTPYISRALGAEKIGEYSYLNSISSYFVLLAVLGTSTYAEREISYYQDNREKRSQRFWDLFVLRMITSSICSLSYFVFIFFAFNNSILALIISLNIISVAFDTVWVFQGMEEFGKITVRNTIIRILTVVLMILLVKKPEDVWLYALINNLSSIIGSFTLYPFLKKYINKPNIKNIHPFKDFKNIIKLFIPTIAISIYTVLDTTMLGLFTSTKVENGYYEEALKISRTALTIVTSLSAVMIPRISYHFEKGEMDEIKRYMYKSYRFVFMLSLPICLGLIGISDNLVPWFFGSGFDKVSLLLKVSAFLVPIIGLSNITGMQYLVPTMQQDKLFYSVLFGALTNFTLNMIFIPLYYSTGAIAASVIAELVVTFSQLMYVRKQLELKKILSQAPHYIISSLLMFILLLVERSYFPSTIIYTLLMILSGAAFYFVVLILMKDETVIETLDKVKERAFHILKRG